jgi:hypothetical protein
VVLQYLYVLLVQNHLFTTLNLVGNKKDLANMISGFSFSMLGLIAALVTFIFAFSNSINFRRYNNNGYVDVLFSLITWTILNLFITAGLSIIGFSPQDIANKYFKYILISFTNNLFQVGLLILILCNLARKSLQQ